MNELNLSTFLSVGKFDLKEIKSFIVSEQEYFITGDTKGNIHILIHSENPKLSLYRTFSGHKKGISSICTIKSWKGNNNIIITGGSDFQAHFWKVSDILNKEQEIQPFFTFISCANICKVKVISQGEISLIS